jgi:hypothetical protein
VSTTEAPSSRAGTGASVISTLKYMAHTALTPQKATSSGVALTFAAADGTNGNSFIPSHGRALHVKNGGGSAITLTLPTPQTVDGLAVADRSVTVGAGAHAVVSVTPELSAYSQADKTVWVDFSSATSVTVALVDQP